MPDTIAQLIRRLSHENPTTRVTAARELGASGGAAAAAVPALAASLSDRHWVVAAAAAEALGKVGYSAVPAVPALAATLSHPDWAVRRSVAKALGDVFEVDGHALRALEELSRSDVSPEVRTACTAAVGRCRVRLAESVKAQIAPLLLGVSLTRLIS